MKRKMLFFALFCMGLVSRMDATKPEMFVEIPLREKPSLKKKQKSRYYKQKPETRCCKSCCELVEVICLPVYLAKKIASCANQLDFE